jgi:hypothetical protein
VNTDKFARKPFIVEGVKVTADNMHEVAEWCKGEIIQTDPRVAEAFKKPPVEFIQVDVQHSLNERQTKAFPGDWVLFANRGFKVYTAKAFERNFEPVFKEGEERPVKIHMDEKKVHRSAETGEFVSAEEAAENPATTVEETVVVEPTGQTVIVETPGKYVVEQKGTGHRVELTPEEAVEFEAAKALEPGFDKVAVESQDGTIIIVDGATFDVEEEPEGAKTAEEEQYEGMEPSA